MAAGDGHVTNRFKAQLLNGAFDLSAATFKIALFNVAYAGSQIDGTPVYGSAPWNANEASGSGYTAGGEPIGTAAVSQDDTNDRAKWDDDGSDVLWTSLATNTIQTAVLYNTAVANEVCIIWEIGTNSNGGNYTLQFHTNGMLLLS